MFYLAGYLFPTGAASLVAPEWVLEVFRSDREYASDLIRFAGTLMTGLGLVVAHLIYYQVEQLYGATLIVRTIAASTPLGIWLSARNPMFLIMSMIMVAGFLLTMVG